MFAPRRADQRRRIALDHAFATQVPAERADRRELARRRRPRVAAVVQVGEKRADLLVVDVLRREVGATPSGRRGHEGEELREVRLVGAHGVQRRVLVQPEVLEKRLDLVCIGCGSGGPPPRRGGSTRFFDVRPPSPEHRQLRAEPRVQIGERPRGLRRLARLLAARTTAVLGADAADGAILWRRHDAERDVRRLVVARIGVRDVVAPARRARSSAAAPGSSWPSTRRGGIPAGHQARRRRLDVALDAGYLAGEEQVVAAPDVCHVSRSTVGPLM